MNNDYSSLPEHRAIVARNADIVVREKIRASIQTRDNKFLTGSGDPLPPQVRAVKKAGPVVDRWRFRDSATHDTVINTPTPAENAEWTRRMATMSGFDGGTMWQGDLAPVGKAVAQVTDALRRVKGSARQKDALSQAVCAIANYGGYLETSEAEAGPSGALAFGGNDDAMTLSDVYAANGIKPDPTTSEGARAEVEMNRRTGDSFNARAAALWDKQTSHQRTPAKIWGKG